MTIGMGKNGKILRVGYCSTDLPAKVNGEHIKSYQVWLDMLRRCYSSKQQIRNPTYIGCTVSHEWLDYTNFHNWYQSQMNANKEGFALDKDILNKGNKIYSSETCVLVPQNINKLFTKRDASRGLFPIGVCYHKNTGKFISCIHVNGKQKHLGLFETTEEAFIAYKKEKEKLIQLLAIELFTNKSVELKLVNAMLQYRVNIND